MSAVQDITVGQKIKLDGENFDVVAIEKGALTKVADLKTEAHEASLRARPLNRYMALSLGPYERGDIITEEWTCLRLKSRTRHWNVYSKYTVTKGAKNFD